MSEAELIKEAGFGAIRYALLSGAEVSVEKEGEVFSRKATGEALVEYLSRVYKEVEDNRTAGLDRIEGVDYKYRIRVSIEEWRP